MASKYSILECIAKAPLARVSLVSEISGAPWMTGRKVDPPAEVVAYKVHKDRPGNLRALYSNLAVPLIRDDLLKVIKDVGVDNMQDFDAVLRDPVKDAEHTNYRALNILGMVAAADLGKSTFMHSQSLTGVDRDFDKLEFKDKLRTDLLLFRLAESSNALVVHEKVKKAIEKSKIEGVVFYDSGEWSG